MRNAWIIARREYGHFFVSPVAYAVAFLFFFVIGLIFTLVKGQAQSPATLRDELGAMVSVFYFISPALTMRLIADEQRSGTLELLLTGPLRSWEIVFGKWLGALLFTLSLLLVTAVLYGTVLIAFGQPDLMTIVVSYVGIALLAATLLSIGMVLTAAIPNVVAVMVVGLAINLTLWISGNVVDAIAGWFSNGMGTGSSWLSYLNFSNHLTSFSRGELNLSDAIYYITFTFVCLYLATRLVESRRWR